jgi:hypothetical protein
MQAQERINRAFDAVCEGLTEFASKVSAAERADYDVWDFIAESYVRFGVDLTGPRRTPYSSQLSPLWQLADKLAVDNVDALTVNSDEATNLWTIQLNTVQRSMPWVRCSLDIVVPQRLAQFEAAWELDALSELVSPAIATNGWPLVGTHTPRGIDPHCFNCLGTGFGVGYGRKPKTDRCDCQDWCDNHDDYCLSDSNKA